MEITPLKIAGACLLRSVRRIDARGGFAETFRANLLEPLCPHLFVQENTSVSTRRGTVRGLHFQAPPHAHDKLIRAVRGSILDVIVDLRRGSPTYGLADSATLKAGDDLQLLAPRGVAHGFCTLEDDTEVAYKLTDYYAPQSEGGLLWCDPALGVDWPIRPEEALVRDRDQTWPTLAAFDSPFD